jgi:hypothetical protein
MQSKVFLFAVVLAAAPLGAQEIITAKAGLIHYMEGEVQVNGKDVQPNGDQFASMKEGDTLSTQEGRVEILLNAGTYLRLSDRSSFRLVSADLEDTRLAALSGQMIVEVSDLPKDTAVTVDLMGSSMALRKRGLYEFSADEPGKVRVYDGELSLTAPGTEALKMGKGRQISMNALIAGPVKFDKEDTTALYRWTARRARYISEVNQTAARSAGKSGGYVSSAYAGSYRGQWVWNPFFGMYTYLPYNGFGYSPFGLVLYSPRTILVPNYSYSTGSGMDMSRSAVSAPAYSGSSAATSVSAPVAAPAAAAPAAPSANTGSASSGGHRR